VVESENFSPISSGQGPFGGVGIETNSQNQICFFGFSHFSTLVDHHYDLDTTRKIQAHQEGQQKTPIWTEIARNAQDSHPRAKMKRIQP